MAFSNFRNLLRERVQKEVSDFGESVLGGEAPDYASYREYVGYIRGLNNSLKLVDEIERDLSE